MTFWLVIFSLTYCKKKWRRNVRKHDYWKILRRTLIEFKTLIRKKNIQNNDIFYFVAKSIGWLLADDDHSIKFSEQNDDWFSRLVISRCGVVSIYFNLKDSILKCLETHTNSKFSVFESEYFVRVGILVFIRS